MPAGMPRYLRSIPVHEDPVQEGAEHAPLLPAHGHALSARDPNASVRPLPSQPEKRGLVGGSKRQRTATSQPSTLSTNGECSRLVGGASDLRMLDGTLATSSATASPSSPRPNAQGFTADADLAATGAADVVSCAVVSATAVDDHDHHHEHEHEQDDDDDDDDDGDDDEDDDGDDDEVATHGAATLWPPYASATPLATSAMLLATDEVAPHVHCTHHIVHRTCTHCTCTTCTRHAHGKCVASAGAARSAGVAP